MIPTYPLLGLLTRGARHGYDLKRTVDTEFASFWRIDFAQLYRSLDKMTRAGWVKSRMQSGTRGPDRKLYTLTPQGRKVFEAWLAEPPNNRAEFFVKLNLATAFDSPASHLIEAQRRVVQSDRAAHIEKQRAARIAGDAGRLVLADAALRESDAFLTALDVCEAVVQPAHRNFSAPLTNALVITGSDDPLLAHLAHFANTSAQHVGSIGGLMALSQHQADVAGAHLLDAASGEYNVPFVKYLVPEENIVLVNLAKRETGLMIATGNPKNIRGLRDLTRRGIRFINRPHGTGTRLLLHSRVRAAKINPHELRDWDRVAATHDAVAAAIATGAADVGPGLRAVAHAWRLDFISLGEERYDLVIPRETFDSSRLRPMLDALGSKDFRRAAESLAGYDLSHTGRVVARIK